MKKMGRMRRCEDEKMRRCEDEEDVKMRGGCEDERRM